MQKKDKRSPRASSISVEKSMQGNKSKNTSPELTFRKLLRSHNMLGYRIHWKIPGNPDVAFVRKKVCIFVHGCFWHRCPHCNLPLPKNNSSFWEKKFEKNLIRDQKNLVLLAAHKWTAIIIWECQIKNSPESIIKLVKKSIETNQ